MRLSRPTIPLSPNETELARVEVFVDFGTGVSWRLRELHVTDRRLVLSRALPPHYFVMAWPLLIGGAVAAVLSLLLLAYLQWRRPPRVERQASNRDISTRKTIETANILEKTSVVLTLRDGETWRLRSGGRGASAASVVSALSKAGLTIEA